MFEISNFSVAYRGRGILHQLGFALPENSVTCITGPSGVGKTTLIRCLNRMLEEAAGYSITGSIAYKGQDLYGPEVNKYELRRKIGMVFQKPTIFPTTIFGNVIFGAKHVQPLKRAEYYVLVEKNLSRVGLWGEVKDRLKQSALELSIGQQQRLAIARTLAVGCDVLLMDEPTSSLDPASVKKIENLILSLKGQKTVVVVTHDLRQARSISDQIFWLSPHRCGAQGKLISDHELLDEALISERTAATAGHFFKGRSWANVSPEVSSWDCP